MRVNTNSPSDAFKARDRKGLDIIRGESELLAIWTVSNKTEKNRTTKESIAAETMVARARAPSGVYRKNWKPNLLSRSLSSGKERNAATVEKAGITHRVDRKKLCRCLRNAHVSKGLRARELATGSCGSGQTSSRLLLAATGRDACGDDPEVDMRASSSKDNLRNEEPNHHR